MTMPPTLILAIDAAIAGGSLCLVENDRDIDHRVGKSNISRAEDLLSEVDEMLSENGRKIADVALIAVSAGPGSFTGIRIGIATGLGLATGLGVEIATESALKAMAARYRGHRDLLVAVPVGRETVCYQAFDTSDTVLERSAPSTEPESSFLSLIAGRSDGSSLLHEDLFIKADEHPLLINFGRNIASSIGHICMSDPRPQTAPMFISKDQ